MNKQDHFDKLNVCIGLVEDLYGPQDTYDNLVELLNNEFPEEGFNLEEVLEFYTMSEEIAHLRRVLET